MKSFLPLPRAVRVAACALLSAACVAGCGRPDERGVRVPVRGAVFLDGQPLDHARIVFEAADGPHKVTATASIVNGFYEIPAERGPLAGPARVEIHPETIDLAEFEAARAAQPGRPVALDAVRIPARYNTKSELEVQVTPDGSQSKFDFKLTTDK